MSAQREDPGPASTEIPDDPRLMEAVQEYMRRTEAGERLDRQEFLDRFADLAEPLSFRRRALSISFGQCRPKSNSSQAPAQPGIASRPHRGYVAGRTSRQR